MLERRTSCRKTVNLRSKLIFLDGSRIVDCTVEDMSEDGARIAAKRGTKPPQRFYLWERQTNMVFECVLCWRKGSTFGVRFGDPCNRVMRQAIMEACSIDTSALAATTPQ